uniref:ABC transporter n=1 Tax=Salvia miltiorrhiza TaxID=226208 RepID=A0A8E7DAS7_SALMI|nr:ABC transporter [Salvia miltiorrhiza]
MLMLLGTFGAVGDGMSTNCLLVYVSRLFDTLGYGKSSQNHANFLHEIEKLILCLLGAGSYGSSIYGRLLLEQNQREASFEDPIQVFGSGAEARSGILRHTGSNHVGDRKQHLQRHLSDSRGPKREGADICDEHVGVRVGAGLLSLLLMEVVTGGLPHGHTLDHTRPHLWEIPSVFVQGELQRVRQGQLHRGAGALLHQNCLLLHGRESIIHKYASILERANKFGIKQGIAKGLAIGSTGLSFAIWALLAWYGSRLIMYKGESGGRIYAAGISFVLGGLSLGSALPEVKYLTEASVAASRIFERIDRVPEIDGEDSKGVVLDDIRGEVEFEHVRFSYPSRPDTHVLNDFNLKIEAGKTVALVGASGSGKSTAIALVQRFYDATGGTVRVDGVDITTLQLKWLRHKMGLVSQEHALFGTSVKENIMFGKLDATMDDVIAAAMAANAHNFIRQLPQGYETKIGERGALLSGGQKQRIAIARAIIRNPVMLLLDEATSALDSESEKLVQNALDQASMGRTTLVVAHKLSTIKNADLIAVVNSGSIAEIGTHDELIDTNGHYARLVGCAEQRGKEKHGEIKPCCFPTVDDHFLSTATTILPSALVSPPTFVELPEWKQGLIGGVSAVIFGTVQPMYALTIGGMISAFFAPSHAEMQARIERYALIFSSLCLASITVNLCQHYNFAYMGECLTRRIRLKMLEKILSFEAAWFDEERNSSAALCARLSNEASMVKSLVADRVSLLIQTTSAVTTAMVMGLIVAWKLALVMIAVQPLTIFCFYIRKVILSSITANFVKAQNQSTQIAAEAVYNHRIVTSFGSIGKVLEMFDQAQDAPRKEARKKSWLAGVGIGSAQGLTFICWALDFWYGGTLVNRGEISAGDVFRTFFILVSTGKVVAEAGSMTSDLVKGSAALASIFAILDRQSPISGSHDGGDGKGGKMSGCIELKKVDFTYPARPETQVLRDFTLEVKAGTSVGLVGKSGCGKSTVIALIQRFYDVDRGSVKVDGVDIRLLNVEWCRKHMALVSQEPVIYSGTIRDNITFGKADASENEVVEAARAANAHEFICGLKNGYETECGERGVQLSGGQKQRIAIARAIVREPRVLLLDEATSALDVQSEQVVQEALDRVMVGRTTVVVAHRLNTIKNLDSIAYVSEGKVVERGTYSHLKSKKGAFYNLASLQGVSVQHI